MLKFLLPAKIAVLSVIALLVAVETSDAQFRFSFGGGNTRVGVNVGQPYYYGSPYYGGYQQPYRYGYGPNNPYGYGPNYPYGYGGYYGPTWSYTTPAPIYVPPVTSYQSNYPPITQENTTANIEVRVPPNAEIWFDGTKTNQTGSVRTFTTPPLTPGTNYSYEVRATWTDEAGAPVTRTQTIQVQPGRLSVVNLMQ